MKTALVLGGGGFIGSHLVKRLKKERYYVRAADLKLPDFSVSEADEFLIADLRDPSRVEEIISGNENEIYQLAAEMGGAGYIFSGSNDATIMHNSCLINLNVASVCAAKSKAVLFYSSSACVYPEFNQNDPDNPICSEDSVFPAQPDSEYGWEKLFSERLYLAFARNQNLQIRIARFHNVYGPEGTFSGGREKAPAALCRKVAEASDKGSIKIWGDGLQTRSFLYIEDCLDGIRALMNSDFCDPVNIGSEEMIRIIDLAEMVIQLSGKKISIQHEKGPTGVRGRNSDNRLMKSKTGWSPQWSLEKGIKETFKWIELKIRQHDKV